jgi:hypothetical protein
MPPLFESENLAQAERGHVHLPNLEIIAHATLWRGPLNLQGLFQALP